MKVYLIIAAMICIVVIRIIIDIREKRKNNKGDTN